jgi:hypothetical protein
VGEKVRGEASVKIVYAEDPARALREFYERELRETAWYACTVLL